ncbi:MAG: 2-amino-4-hydroxy-6-hydroxymethyldihydropteridine diphosphokinase [Armatimonadetes bacterium]|nr:2-amino-4-hydroxy-6-hydroxymethyldihydropteridine diphosphokinase [Armatimonadota bacterium]
MKTVYLALGSNLGDRLGHLRFALQKLEQNGVVIEAKSKIYAAQSVEGGGEGDFFNAAIRARTDLCAPQLREICENIEAEAGRAAPPRRGGHRSGARCLDIDILLFGDETFATPELEIPHPRALRRNFVLRPLLDVLQGGWIRESEETL